MSGMQPWAAPDIVAGYHLADANDFSGNSRTLTNNGSVAFGLGKFGNCAIFSGSNSLSRADNAGLTLANDYTVLMWTQVTTAPTSGNYSFIYQNRLNGGRYHQIAYYNDSGTLNVRIHNTGANTAIAATLTLNVWYHFAIRNSSDVLELFLNGGFFGSAAKSTTNASATDFDLGGITGYFQKGKIDEVVVIPTAITNADIRRRYAFQKGMLI